MALVRVSTKQLEASQKLYEASRNYIESAQVPVIEEEAVECFKRLVDATILCKEEFGKPSE